MKKYEQIFSTFEERNRRIIKAFVKALFLTLLSGNLVFLITYFHLDKVSSLLLFALVITMLALLSGLWAPTVTTTAIILFLLLFQNYDIANINAPAMQMALYVGIFGYSVCIAIKMSRLRLDKIKQREQLARSLLDHSLHPIILQSKDGTIIKASRSILVILGRSPRELRNKRFDEYVHKEDTKKIRAFFKLLINNPGKRKQVDLRFVCKDGKIVWLRNHAVNLLNHPDIKAIVGSLQDISEQKELDQIKEKILASEKKAREMAEQAVKERDEFISIASHELRTPLTNILLQLQSTLGQILNQSLADFSGPKLFKKLTIAEQQSQRLSILIKDLLNASLASTGMIIIKPESVRVSDLIKGIVDRLEAQIKKHKTKIKLELKDTHTGYWDPIRLEQAITNLITNAVKYGHGKPVIIKTSSNAKETTIAVQDQGPGIKKAEQKHIFKLFHRCKETEKKQGLGIGLYITKKIVDAHKGKIKLKSVVGEGTTFTITLPNGKPPPADKTRLKN